MKKTKLTIAEPAQADKAARALRTALKPVKTALKSLPANDDAESGDDSAWVMQCAISRMFF